ncbi:2-polyprenyl-6-methoxyphenol hydroxylase-like FAD-dependent oxidoreductase [Nocardia tenerifensis]|uniref:2-polyprenyl-6-methoxyphenol hydroxylase-like FAD-dependent oxidoreductase n=1 Tax=Nocardia tenerifensis TaxID=228006 RepID=A0A318KC54_9NOCA|nr:FAD-dependent monooxygenase [Nocardia tenerifensis]PXX71706.1 2-polyprenyl-6-methoxyphenol hydroxylase-like FAD-dependent oxidoreductase [Nocardia tenerifensis]
MGANCSSATQVLIVGAGPVGLVLATELAQHGVGVLVVERAAAPSDEPRASQVDSRTMEFLDRRDLLGGLGPLPRVGTGHFGGLPLSLEGVRSRFRGHWRIPQPRLTAALDARARELGVPVLRSHELTGFTASDRVRAELQTPTGPVSITAGYLVGCDGHDSVVRARGGFAFPGTSATRTLLWADLDGIELQPRRFQRLPAGLAVAASREDGGTRVMVHAYGYHRPAGRVEPDELVREWHRVTGERLDGATVRRIGLFDNESRLVDRFRRGRVLLAGDAAHRHLHVGGMSLNQGIHDAIELGWKLAMTITGRAPGGLLESYHDQRHAAGAAAAAVVAAQEVLLLGHPKIEPLRALLGQLLAVPEISARLAEAVSGWPSGALFTV